MQWPPQPQAQGSMLSYMRRYALQAACGVSGSDDDGNAAQAATQRVAKAGPTKAQMAKMHAAFTDAGIDARDDRLQFVAGVLGHDVATSADLSAADVGRVIDALADFVKAAP